MYILTHIDSSDSYQHCTNLAVASSKEKLESIVKEYPAIRDAYFNYSGKLYSKYVNQNSKLFKLKPFVLNYKREFWPFVIQGEALFNRMYRVSKDQGIIIENILNEYKKNVGFPMIYPSSAEDFDISYICEV